MNVTHLGDALDFWKGALIDMLSRHLRNVHVLPMFTDKNVADDWTEGRLRTYARLLRVDRRRILRSRDRFPTPSRADDFKDLPVAIVEDLFVDPDTGVAPESEGDGRHIRLSELAQLMPPGFKRIVLVYQHAPRFHRDSNWVDARLKDIAPSSHFSGCRAFAYDAGSVAMIFVSRDRQRLARLHSTLTDLADPRRVTSMSGGQAARDRGCWGEAGLE